MTPRQTRTEKRSVNYWMLTCRGNSEQLWPRVIGRRRVDALEYGAKHFRVTPEYLVGTMKMRPVRVTLTYSLPKERET